MNLMAASHRGSCGLSRHYPDPALASPAHRALRHGQQLLALSSEGGFSRLSLELPGHTYQALGRISPPSAFSDPSSLGIWLHSAAFSMNPGEQQRCGDGPTGQGTGPVFLCQGLEEAAAHQAPEQEAAEPPARGTPTAHESSPLPHVHSHHGSGRTVGEDSGALDPPKVFITLTRNIPSYLGRALWREAVPGYRPV
ncbi:hypothetical protein TURU_004272 [Turdus rufiventris]|nr:hypothetical protein TURU_004272 [Turdus rufiventris]